MDTAPEKLYDLQVSDLSATALLTLYCRSLESQSPSPLINDPKAVEIVRQLGPVLSRSENPLHRDLANNRIKQKLVVHIALRARKYDDYVRGFLSRAPGGVVVDIGCGLDTRFWRIDNGSVCYYDLDLPEVIELKKRFVAETERYLFIASSAFDKGWMDDLLRWHGSGPYLFLAEGLFMYFPGEAVKALVLGLQSRFPGAGLACEVVSALWVREPFSTIVRIKQQRELHLGEGTTYRSGLESSDEMEEWSPGIKLLDEWSYLDEDEPKIGWVRTFRHLGLFRKMQYTVHYRLGK